LNEDEILKLNIGDFLVEEDRERAFTNISKMFQGISSGPGEHHIKRPDGGLLDVEIKAGFILNPEGQPDGLVFVMREISKRKQIEEALRESEEIFNQFMINSPIYVFFKDKEIRSLRLSKNYEQMLGRPLDDLIGKNMDDLFPSDFAKKMIEDDKHVLNEGKLIEIEEELDGRYYTTIKYPIFKNGKPCYLAGFTIDITEKKNAENALRQKANELERFNNMMLGRELKMIELKKEINELLKKAGEKEKYKIHE
jgi:PAS domain S-box-containing protein